MHLSDKIPLIEVRLLPLLLTEENQTKGQCLTPKVLPEWGAGERPTDSGTARLGSTSSRSPYNQYYIEYTPARF